jgi:homoserine O-succinyltransferase
VRIAIVNLMPHAAEFADMLMPQFAAADPIEPVWIRARGRRYGLDDPAWIDRTYVPFTDAGALDAVVITGAAVEHLPYSEVRFLAEVQEILTYARERELPILGLCWGALAVGHLLLGVATERYPHKVFGAFETDLQTGDPHVFLDGMDDRFFTAHSRYAGFDESSVRRREAAGGVRVLARAPMPAGTVIAESPDHSVLLHVGHPEYGASRLAEEFRRDVTRGVSGVARPVNVDLDGPRCRWRSHSRTFFANWVRLVHERARARSGAGVTWEEATREEAVR